MFDLYNFREENETGFTLIELLVVILIIGILAAIAIPMFLNQRKSAVDAAVQSDVRNAAGVVETALVTKLGAKTAVNAALVDGKVSTSPGSVLAYTGDSNGYCVTGTNPGGDVAASGGFAYASLEGGMKTLDDSHTCKAGKIVVGKATAPAAPGTLSWTGQVRLYNDQVNATFLSDVTAVYVPGSRTVRFTYTKPDDAPVAMDEMLQIYVNYGCTNGSYYSAAYNGGGTPFTNGLSEFNIVGTMGGCDVNRISVVENSNPGWWGPAEQMDATLS